MFRKMMFAPLIAVAGTAAFATTASANEHDVRRIEDRRDERALRFARASERARRLERERLARLERERLAHLAHHRPVRVERDRRW